MTIIRNWIVNNMERPAEREAVERRRVTAVYDVSKELLSRWNETTRSAMFWRAEQSLGKYRMDSYLHGTTKREPLFLATPSSRAGSIEAFLTITEKQIK